MVRKKPADRDLLYYIVIEKIYTKPLWQITEEEAIRDGFENAQEGIEKVLALRGLKLTQQTSQRLICITVWDDTDRNDATKSITFSLLKEKLDQHVKKSTWRFSLPSYIKGECVMIYFKKQKSDLPKQPNLETFW